MTLDVKTYRKQVGFDELGTSPAERAKYLLFFVTRLARLRNDMTPAVIVERLYDWGYDDITADEIISAFHTDSDVRSSKTRKGAYEITQVAEMRVRKHLKSLEAQVWRSTTIQVVVGITVMALIALLALVAYNLATSKVTVRELSFPEFRRRIGFDETSTDPSDRAKYFLYFITKVVELREDMTPDVIEERLKDIGYFDITAAEITDAFLQDADIQESQHRQGAFQISPLAQDKFEVMLDLQFPPAETLTLEWLWRHIPIEGWGAVSAGILALISGSFALGYRLALHAPKKG